MKHGNTLIELFALLSLTVLSLWAIKDLWLVILMLASAVWLYAKLTKGKS